MYRNANIISKYKIPADGEFTRRRVAVADDRIERAIKLERFRLNRYVDFASSAHRLVIASSSVKSK